MSKKGLAQEEALTIGQTVLTSTNVQVKGKIQFVYQKERGSMAGTLRGRRGQWLA